VVHFFAAPEIGGERLAAGAQRREGDDAVPHPLLAVDAYATITVSFI